MKSVFGLEQNLAAALSYVLFFFTGIAVLVLERENKFVRFHALQSSIWFIILFVVRWVLSFIGRIWLIGFVLSPVLTLLGFALSLVFFVSWVVLIFKAYQGEAFKLPIIGDIVWARINK